jgi:hypothetical protein
MRLSPAFVRDLVVVHPKELIDLLKRDNRPSFDDPWRLKNEIRPVDIYCYFGARFGAPNGIQNLFCAEITPTI